MCQGDLDVAGGVAGAHERGDVFLVGQLVSLLECVQRSGSVTLGLPDLCQRAVAANLNLHVAAAPAQFDPPLQVVGGRFQVVPFVEQGAQFIVGQSDGGRLSP